MLGRGARRRRRLSVDASLIKADASRQKGVEGCRGLPSERASRAIDEYLAGLDDAAFGAATAVTPKFLSPADPAARWTGAHGGQAFFAYCANYLIDLDHAVIVDVEASTAVRPAEVTAAKTMIERTEARFELYPERLVGDAAYGSAEMLAWLVHERGIEPHVPVFDKSRRTDGTFSREDFTYDHDRDVYVCPAGKTLRTRGTRVNDGATTLYRASKRDCDACALKARCCPKAPARKVPRAASTRAPATWPATSPGPTPGVPPGGRAKRSRCCSPTSSASCVSTDCDYEDPTAPATSSSSPPPPKTSANSPS